MLNGVSNWMSTSNPNWPKKMRKWVTCMKALELAETCRRHRYNNIYHQRNLYYCKVERPLHSQPNHRLRIYDFF